MSRRNLVAAVVAAGVIAGALIAASLVLGGGSGDGSPGTTATGGGESSIESASLAVLRGLPQHGTTLGNSGAGATLVEYADLQCPFCARFSRDSLPELVRRWVRPGKVKIEFRGLAFLGPDSDKALRFALAAKERNRFWQVVRLLYENQGDENSGWVTDRLLRAVARAAGLDPAATLAASRKIPQSEIDRLNEAGSRDGVSGTPFFLVARAGGTPVPVGVGALKPDAFTAAFDAALTR